MPPRSDGELMLMYAESEIRRLNAFLERNNDSGSQSYQDHVQHCMMVILGRLHRCTTLPPLDACRIIGVIQTALLAKPGRDMLVDTILSKTTPDTIIIDDGDQECDSFYSYLTDSDIMGLTVATSHHEAIQVLLKRMLNLRLTHCRLGAYEKIAEVAIGACKNNLGSKLKLILALQRNVRNTRPRQRVAGTPIVYPDSPARLMVSHADLFREAYPKEPPFSFLPRGLAAYRKYIETQEPWPKPRTIFADGHNIPSCGIPTTHLCAIMADPSSSSVVHQQGMAEFPAPMIPPGSVASSSMSTILDTRSPPPRTTVITFQTYSRRPAGNGKVRSGNGKVRSSPSNNDTMYKLGYTGKPGYSGKPGYTGKLGYSSNPGGCGSIGSSRYPDKSADGRRNKDSKAKADAVLATTQQAAPKRRLKRKTTVQE